MNYERFSFSTTDALTQINVRSSTHNATILFDTNKVFNNFTYFLMFNYGREREGSVYLVRHKIQGGLIGLKYDFYEGEMIKDLSLSLIPLYEYLVEEVETLNSNGLTEFSGVITRNIRNSLRLRLIVLFKSLKLKMKETFFYRPIYDLQKSEFDFQDANLENKFKLSYLIDEKFSFSYLNKYTWNRRLKTVHNISSSDIQHTFTLDFNHEF
jgi:hypothetical protein